MVPSAQRGRIVLDEVTSGPRRIRTGSLHAANGWFKGGPDGATVFLLCVFCFTCGCTPGHPRSARTLFLANPPQQGRGQACILFWRGGRGGRYLQAASPGPGTYRACVSSRPRKRVLDVLRQMGHSGRPPGVRAPPQVLARPESTPQGPGTRALPPCGESHPGEPPRALPPDRGPLPPTRHARSGLRAAQLGHGQARGRSVRESRIRRRLTASPGISRASEVPSVFRESRGGPRGPPRFRFQTATTTTRAVSPRSRGLDCTPLRAPRQGHAGPAHADLGSARLPPGRGEKPPC
ncbi:hypothetical protein NDU88_001022 [Pleurodeles waltl]|uniref:Uncharacterized protein n=1 Tax=Pleurodeles waltl TaxID=8319 RepID=A0AAV7VA26_PLEWA|nr:hypothetical protein NDU88_001022 [Pleurodeles waltl]